MKAVILVGGEGTRLRPLTCNTPKSMVPILNRPFLEHIIDYLKGHAIDDVIQDQLQPFFAGPHFKGTGLHGIF